MLKLALFFFLISIIAGVFGYTNLAAGTAEIARILFFICILVFLILLVLGIMAGSTLL